MNKTSKTKMFVHVLIVCGVLLRLKLYTGRLSLWLDEAWVAYDILTKSFKNVFLANAQFSDLPVLPMGFSLMEKLFIHFLGAQEQAFRAFPFFCGAISIVLFYKLLKQVSAPRAQLIALGLFVFCEPMIHYSSEIKQYSCDVMVGLGVYLLALYVRANTLNMKQVRMAAFFGVAAMTFSYPAVFVLIASGAMLFIEAYMRKDQQKVSSLVYIYFVWALGLIFWYIASYRSMTSNSFIISVASSRFVPWPIWSLEALVWTGKKIMEIFQYSLSQAWPVAAMTLFVLGVKSLYKKDKPMCGMMVGPLFLLFVISALHKYPLEGRFFLFVIPSVFILIAEGAEHMVENSRRFKWPVQLLLIGLLFVEPVAAAGHNMIHSVEKEENRQVMQLLRQRQKKGDRLCLNLSAQYAYLYYREALNFQHDIQPIFLFSDELSKEQEGGHVYARSVFRDHRKREDYDALNKESPRLKINRTSFEAFGKGSRTWFLFSHSDQDLQEWMIDNLKKHGTMLTKLQRRGAAVYLFDLSQD